jgi:hypothetical protein
MIAEDIKSLTKAQLEYLQREIQREIDALRADSGDLGLEVGECTNIDGVWYGRLEGCYTHQLRVARFKDGRLQYRNDNGKWRPIRSMWFTCDGADSLCTKLNTRIFTRLVALTTEEDTP